VDPREEEFEEEADADGDEIELVPKLLQTKVKDIHKVWLRVEPAKEEFVGLINECFTEGLECLKHFERWSRHEDLDPYQKVLESWDDKVCDVWETPDDNFLNCEEWLNDTEEYNSQEKMIKNYMELAFIQVDRVFERFAPYLHQFWENKRCGDFAIVEDERLRNPTEMIDLLLRRFETQKEEFEDIKSNLEVGMLIIHFKDIKSELVPNPKQCLERMKKILPAMTRFRINECKDWMQAQMEALKMEPIKVDQYVAQVQALEYIEKNFPAIRDKIQLC